MALTLEDHKLLKHITNGYTPGSDYARGFEDGKKEGRRAACVELNGLLHVAMESKSVNDKLIESLRTTVDFLKANITE